VGDRLFLPLTLSVIISTMTTSKYKNVAICGDIGTGTTTLSKGLAKHLNWKHISAGDFFREYAKKHNIPLWDKSRVPDDVERKVDKEFLDKMKNEKQLVFDSHYGGWFAKDLSDVLRILLVCDNEIATQRIISRESDHKETTADIEKRGQGLRTKFKKLYSSDDYESPKYFHLVVNTTNTGIASTLEISLKKFIETE